MSEFDHEFLDVYRAALALDEVVVGIARSAPRGHAWIGDQAMRASGSTCLNLSEGVGRTGADRIRCWRIAYGSTLEVDTALTLLFQRGACGAEERARARELNVRVAKMLKRMTR